MRVVLVSGCVRDGPDFIRLGSIAGTYALASREIIARCTKSSKDSLNLSAAEFTGNFVLLGFSLCSINNFVITTSTEHL